MRRCVIHIGTHKTGTSSIQSTWFENRAVLKSKFNLHYFSNASNHWQVCTLFLDNPENFLPDYIRNLSKEECEVKSQALRRKLIAEIEATAPQPFVLSAEDLIGLTDVEVARLKTFLDKYFDSYTILVYVRHPFSYLSSIAQQNAKTGLTFQEMLNERFMPEALGGAKLERFHSIMPRFQMGIEKYQTAFGHENVIIRNFDKTKLIQNDVVHDFAQALFPDLAIMAAIEPIHTNESLSHEVVLLLEAINQKYPLVQGRLSPERASNLIQKMKPIKTGNKFEFSNIDMNAYADAVRDDVAWLSETTDGKIHFDISEPPTLNDNTSPSDILDMCAELTNKLAISEYNAVTMNLFFRLMHNFRQSEIFNEAAFANILRRCSLQKDFFTIVHILSNEGRFTAAHAAAKKATRLFPEDDTFRVKEKNLASRLKK